MTKNILITGGAGFIGSNLAIHLQTHLPGCRVFCFDNLYRAGSPLNARRLMDRGIHFIQGDIRNKSEVFSVPETDLIIDCCAEPAVLAAYGNPLYTIDTNLLGTIHCLELAREKHAGFIFLSTSRVYPIDRLEALPFDEHASRFDWPHELSAPGISYQGLTHEFPLDGIRSLYGATKLSAEFIIQEYLEMFNLEGVINRCGMVAGPWQMGKVDQGVVTFWTAQHIYNKPLRYIGFGGLGKQVRDVLHVADLCELIFYQIEHLELLNKKCFNIGGGRANAVSLLELTREVQNITGKKITMTADPQTRKSDVRIYMTDNAGITQQTGWAPRRSIGTIIQDVTDWISEHQPELQNILTS